MGKTKKIGVPLNGVVGARHTGLCQELQCCCFFCTQQFSACMKNGPPPKGHPANLTQLWKALESTWVSIPVQRFLTLWSPCPDELTLFGGQKGNSILGRCSECLVYSVYIKTEENHVFDCTGPVKKYLACPCLTTLYFHSIYFWEDLYI
jgi:hypothetical protein